MTSCLVPHHRWQMRLAEQLVSALARPISKLAREQLLKATDRFARLWTVGAAKDVSRLSFRDSLDALQVVKNFVVRG